MVASPRYGDLFFIDLPFADSVFPPLLEGLCPTVVLDVDTNQALAATPVRRDFTIRSCTGSVAAGLDGRPAMTICGVHPEPRERDDLTPLVPRMAELTRQLVDLLDAPTGV